MALQRAITPEDMEANPILVELEGAVGDVVSIFHPQDPNEVVIVEEQTDSESSEG